MAETIIVTGVLGQDGAYLSRLLLDNGANVVGLARQRGPDADWRLRELGIAGDVEVRTVDLAGPSAQVALIEDVRPSRIFNLAAQSQVALSFREPVATASVNALGALQLLDAVRLVDPGIRFFQASSSEMFGTRLPVPPPAGDNFAPRSPYAIAKLFAHHATQMYREAYGLHASSGILFNHESPLRADSFVTRKITAGLVRWARAGGAPLRLGNLDAARDWGHARDVVRGMWLATDRTEADDYVFATGHAASVRDFAIAVAARLGLALHFEGTGTDEVRRLADGRVVIVVDPALFRPIDVPVQIGDAAGARSRLGWVPEYDFDALVTDMVDAECRRLDLPR